MPRNNEQPHNKCTDAYERDRVNASHKCWYISFPAGTQLSSIATGYQKYSYRICSSKNADIVTDIVSGLCIQHSTYLHSRKRVSSKRSCSRVCAWHAEQALRFTQQPSGGLVWLITDVLPAHAARAVDEKSAVQRNVLEVVVSAVGFERGERGI